METYSGICVSKGMIRGPIVIKKNSPELGLWQNKGSSEEEQERFNFAVQKSKLDVEALIKKSSGPSLEILEAHLMLLEDPELLDQTNFKIESGYSAQEGYNSVVLEFKKLFNSVEDAYIKQRVHDLDDISKRVLFYIQSPSDSFQQVVLDQPSIIFADELNPSELLSLDRRNLLGVVLSHGSAQSHTSILCRSLEVPSIVKSEIDLNKIKSGCIAYLDANHGQIFINPSDTIISELEYKRSLFEEEKKELVKLKGVQTKTLSGKLCPLGANISGPQDIKSVLENDAELVGLYRTEFLFLDRNEAPSEDEQYDVYKKVFDKLGHLPITIRTLDIGGDKTISYLDIEKEENPFLGVRGIRLCLKFPDLFKTQLKAILRASVNCKNTSIMFPMVSTLDEIVQSLELLNISKQELLESKVPFNNSINLGVMMEVPSLAFMLQEVSNLVSFISIGTNDLFQYANACDRMNNDLSSISDPNHLGFLRFLEFIITSSKKVGLHVGVCGSIAHHPDIMPKLIKFGVDDLSMTAQHILTSRKSIIKLS